jgi:ankyrin repeat protein
VQSISDVTLTVRSLKIRIQRHGRRAGRFWGYYQYSNHDEAEVFLRDEGVDPDAAYPDGTTGLHMAALNNSVEWASLRMSSSSQVSSLLMVVHKIGQPEFSWHTVLALRATQM